ncbi:late gene regulator [Escherichia coli]|uniref:Late gene regulator n=1 Tax=Escherichia coli TaxID=562 RepID=A0A376WU43_ECOLX|nr:late gene regulator [Escherichia coli]
MKLEASLKHFSPQGMHISDDVKGTSPDRITGTDVMAAIGTTSSRARFGLAAFFGKTGISKSDELLAVQALRVMQWNQRPGMYVKQLQESLAGAC